MNNLKPFEVYQKILRHPKLVHSLLPHFTVIKKQFPLYTEEPNITIRSILQKALPTLQGRIYAWYDHQTYELILGFEEGSDATFFELIYDDEIFLKQ